MADYNEEPPINDPHHLLPAESSASKSRRPLIFFLIGFAILFLVVLAIGLIPRLARDRETKRRAEEQKNALPVVEVVTVQAPKDGAGPVVPGTTLPLVQAYVYGRANGYLKKRLVDIGDHVKKDQLLAVIDAPDLDEQVAQARQQVLQAEQQLEQQKSQLILATATVQRYRVLVAKGVFSRQDGDQQEANYSSQVANVAAARRNVDAYQANLRRTVALQSYEYVRAPFAGIITERDADVGALVSASGSISGGAASAPQGQSSTSGGTTQAGQSNNAGSSGSINSAATSAQSPGQGGPLFGVAQVQRLRVLVSVPETFATQIHTGQMASLSLPDMKDKPLAAEVTRTADSIDANTRTMLTELQIDNSAGKLIPGTYVVVNFPSVVGSGPILITGDAVLVRHDKPAVATVVDGKVHIVPVIIGRDLGNAVEILSGLKPGDVVVTQVTDDVTEGAKVKTSTAKPAAGGGQS
jgi:multidrug efflux pump subunit AcrA (membrane-fusion protein)